MHQSILESLKEDFYGNPSKDSPQRGGKGRDSAKDQASLQQQENVLTVIETN